MTLDAYLLSRESFFLDLQYYSCVPKALNLTIFLNLTSPLYIPFTLQSLHSLHSLHFLQSQILILNSSANFYCIFLHSYLLFITFSPFVSPRFLSYFTSAPHRRAANLPSHPLYTRTPSLRGPKLEKIYIYLNIINIYIYIHSDAKIFIMVGKMEKICQ